MDIVDHEVYALLKSTIEQQLEPWMQRQRQLTAQCIEAAASMQKLAEDQQALQKQLERCPEVFAKHNMANLKLYLEKQNTADQSRLQELERKLESCVPIDEVNELHSAIEGEQQRAEALQHSLGQENGQEIKAALAEQLAVALRDAEQTREKLLALTQSLQSNEGGAQEKAATSQASQQPITSEEVMATTKQTRPRPTDAAQDVSQESVEAGEAMEDRDWEQRIHVVIEKAGFRKQRMGEILEKAELITAEQLEKALEAQKTKPHRHLGDILIDLNMTTPEVVALVLAVQSKVDYVRLNELQVQPEAACLISERMAQQHGCIPVRATEESLSLAIANPMDLVAIEDVECATNRTVQILVATEQDIQEAIEKFYWEPE